MIHSGEYNVSELSHIAGGQAPKGAALTLRLSLRSKLPGNQ
jgi:hypothetical protein